MNVFLFWILIIAVILSGYLFFIYRRSPKGFRFQVKLTIIFILLVLAPAIPLTSFVSAFLTRGVEMFLLPGIEESLSSSLEVIKFQLEERGELFFDNFSEVTRVNPEVARKNSIVYYARLENGDEGLKVNDITGTEIELLNQNHLKNPDIYGSIFRKEMKSRLFYHSNRNFCEIYRVLNEQNMMVIAFSIHPKIILAKDNITESLRVYNSLSLFKKSVVEGQIIWGFATLFIIVLTIISIYAAKSLSRGISEPIQELTLGMQRVANGDLNVPVKVKANDEIKFLIDSFNKMAQDLKTSQEKLVRAERLAAWQDVARRISHEIKNTLTPIQLSIRRLWNADNLKGKARNDSLIAIQDEVESMRKISEEFSEFARMPQIKPQKENINEIIRNLVAFIQAEPGNYRINMNLDETLPPINLDRLQFRRALNNIIKNAIEAGEGKSVGNEIFIKTQPTTDSNKSIKISIRDHGKGMEPAMLVKIFEPYFTTKKRGMGLGLSIVKRIIEDHGGQIEYNSQPGKGTRVTIFI